MAILSTEWAAESAMYYVCKELATVGSDLNFYMGEFSVNQEIDSPFCKIVCKEVKPETYLKTSSTNFELATVEIQVGVHVKTIHSGWDDNAKYRNNLIGSIRAAVMDATLETYQNTGISLRGTAAPVVAEPSEVYNPAIVRSIIAYDSSTKDYHARTLRFEFIIGETRS